MAYFTGTPPETWAPTRFPKVELKGVAGSGANAPIEEIMAKRADFATIDNVAWPQLAEAGARPRLLAGRRRLPEEHEMSTDVGLAVDKKRPGVPAWLQAVYDEMKDKVTAEELEHPEGRLALDGPPPRSGIPAEAGAADPRLQLLRPILSRCARG